MLYAHCFQLKEKSNVTVERIAFISQMVMELSEIEVHLRTRDNGTTRWQNDGKQPVRGLLRPAASEQRTALDYVINSHRAGGTGRLVKAYFTFVQTERPKIYYCGGIYSTLKAAKDNGPVDFIALIEHRGGKRNIRFDPPEIQSDLWGLESR